MIYIFSYLELYFQFFQLYVKSQKRPKSLVCALALPQCAAHCWCPMWSFVSEADDTLPCSKCRVHIPVPPLT